MPKPLTKAKIAELQRCKDKLLESGVMNQTIANRMQAKLDNMAAGKRASDHWKTEFKKIEEVK